MLSLAIVAINVRLLSDALAMCGRSTTFSMLSNSGSTAGSFSKTSRPAAAIVLLCNARTSAFSSTIGPRAVLMRMAVGFIIRRHLVDIVIEYLHVKAAGTPGYNFTDTAGTNQPKR